ncbi:MAG: ribosome assembly factor SBDS [Nanohaloarchaea archaeon SW_10_44_10]|nr:MAG: ribosome assembly factor SBDS [Nanohaloarchaea archaeon SW_10_44_10]
MDTSDAIKLQYRGDKQFEILVEPDLAKESKLEGKEHEIQRMLFVQEIFTDAGEGERASTEEIDQEFGTRQIMEAAEEIFEKGDMQLTTEQKAEMREEKWKQLISMISRRVQNPKTGNPHPPDRVENGLEEAGFNINWDSDLEEEFEDAIDELRPIIPVSLDKKTVAIRIPNDQAGKAYDKLQQAAEIEEEQWGNEYFTARVTLPAGVLSELIDELQDMTSGKTEMKEV